MGLHGPAVGESKAQQQPLLTPSSARFKLALRNANTTRSPAPKGPHLGGSSPSPRRAAAAAAPGEAGDDGRRSHRHRRYPQCVHSVCQEWGRPRQSRGQDLPRRRLQRPLLGRRSRFRYGGRFLLRLRLLDPYQQGGHSCCRRVRGLLSLLVFTIPAPCQLNLLRRSHQLHWTWVGFFHFSGL